MNLKALITTGILAISLSMTGACKLLQDEQDDSPLTQQLTLLGLLSQSGDPGEEFSGGQTTTFDTSVNAFDLVAANISSVERNIQFLDGNTIFNLRWVEAPAAAFDGVGPTFNRSSCRGCHVGDGRGRPPIAGETEMLTMLVRLSQAGSDGVTGGPLALTNYGGQLQDKSIAGVDAEGQATITWTEVPGSFPDGEAYSLRRPTYNFSWNFGTPGAFLFSPRVAPQVYGLGLLQAVSESTILSFVDQNDSNGDGISGKANYVWDQQTSSAALGRFGWKANQPNLRQQAAGASLGDMGITTTLNSSENCPGSQTVCAGKASGNAGNPHEMSTANLDLLTFYQHTLSVPGRRNWTDSTVRQGKALFNQIGCASCHIPKMTTGELDGFPELSNQTIRPYTDLLLHDMGADLADNRPDFLADGQEWRTPPLWGTGLIETVNGHDNLLHDGRARGFKEAILWHGGEAETSRESFKGLTRTERDAIISFLGSL